MFPCLRGLLLCCFFVAGCAGHAVVRPSTTLPADLLSAPAPDRDVQAMVVPPLGWHPDPLKHSDRHDHQVWISPSGNTAYGVIHFSLPLPWLSDDVVLWGFLREMKRTEGQATLLSKNWDSNLNALRFVAEGGRYCVRTNLFVRGFDGWAVYAGTMRSQPMDTNELDLAERAREHTGVGLSD